MKITKFLLPKISIAGIVTLLMSLVVLPAASQELDLIDLAKKKGNSAHSPKHYKQLI